MPRRSQNTPMLRTLLVKVRSVSTYVWKLQQGAGKGGQGVTSCRQDAMKAAVESKSPT